MKMRNRDHAQHGRSGASGCLWQQLLSAQETEKGFGEGDRGGCVLENGEGDTWGDSQFSLLGDEEDSEATDRGQVEFNGKGGARCPL